MRECDNSKIHISSNFLLSICLIIMLDTLLLVPSLHCNTQLHFTTLHHTSPNYTTLHLSILHFLSFALHYPLIWLNPFTFPIVLFPPTSLNQTQYGYHIPQRFSKIINPFTALKNLSLFHFTFFLFFSFFTYPINNSLHFTLLCYSPLKLASLNFTSLHFLLFIAFTSPTILHFPNPRFENMSFTVGSPYNPFRQLVPVSN